MQHPRYKYYSVYVKKTDEPVIIHAQAPECAKAMGVTLATFWNYVTRNNTGKLYCKYEIVIDDPEEDDDGEAQGRHRNRPQDGRGSLSRVRFAQ